MLKRLPLIMFTFGCLLFGCDGQNAPTEPKETTKKSFSEVVEDLMTMHDKIGDAFANGNPEDAHGALHEVGHTLGKIAVRAAAEKKLTVEQTVQLQSASKSLSSAYGELDNSLHGHDGKPYVELKDEMNSSMDVIRRLAGFKNFAEVVSDIVAMRNTVRDGFASGDLDSAHGPLHEVGHSLEKLEGLAAKENLDAQQMESLKKATDELFDAFGEVDKTFHGAEGKSYDEVADEIGSALQVVCDLAGVEFDKSEAAPESSSDDVLPDEVEVQEVEDSSEDQDDETSDSDGL